MLPEKHWPRGRHGELAQPAQHSPGPASFPPLLAYQFGPINYAAPPVPINAAHGGVGWEWGVGGGKRHGDAHRHPPPNPRGCLWGSPRISFPLSRPSSNAEIPDAARQAFFLLPTQPRGGRRPAAARTAVGSHRTAPRRSPPSPRRDFGLTAGPYRSARCCTAGEGPPAAQTPSHTGAAEAEGSLAVPSRVRAASRGDKGCAEPRSSAHGSAALPPTPSAGTTRGARTAQPGAAAGNERRDPAARLGSAHAYRGCRSGASWLLSAPLRRVPGRKRLRRPHRRFRSRHRAGRPPAPPPGGAGPRAAPGPCGGSPRGSMSVEWLRRLRRGGPAERPGGARESVPRSPQPAPPRYRRPKFLRGGEESPRGGRAVRGAGPERPLPWGSGYAE